jgi:hypothetical protein
LIDFPGRWLVFRTAELAAGLERAVIDVAPSRHDTVEGLAEMESRAQFAVGEGHDATLVLMYLSRKPRPGHDPHAAPATQVLAITVWSLAHPVAVAGHIEFDEAGTPAWVDAPYALHRTSSHRMH